ncbi:MAG: Fic family protein [Gemmatimonadota bacterium]|nr:Fic family protein [Gemmatimonadota bacterium]
MPPRPRTTPRERALAWWKERVDADRYVVPSSESPAPAVARLLRADRLILEVANRRVWILTEPDRTDDRGIFLRNYWLVVAELLRRWAPAAIVGIPAVQLHLGETAPPAVLPAIHRANASRYAIELFDEFRVQLRPGSITTAQIVDVPAQGAAVSVLKSASLLTTLDLAELELGMEPTSAWLRHLVLRTPDLDAALAERPRPLVLARLGELAKGLGNVGLSKQIDAAVGAISTFPPSAAATGVGTRVVVPASLTALPRGTGQPWLDRQLMVLDRFRSVLDRLLEDRVGPPPGMSLARLVGNARQAKQYDAYHNTTMEGYRITKAVSDAVVNGTPLPETSSHEELRAIMAVQGYSRAFDLVIDLVRTRPAPTIDEALILDLYVALFRPSVDAGIVTEDELRGWRSINVGLAGGWRHAPPAHTKVASLIGGLSAFVAQPELRPLTRAVLTQLEFVTIHPFLDGNGRLARLLMNYALLNAGYPWVTIRSDERRPYFQALERAQVESEIETLGEFLAVHIRHAADAAKASAPAANRRRR